MWLWGEGCSWQREQQVQRPWARSALGEPMGELVLLLCSERERAGSGQAVAR